MIRTAILAALCCACVSTVSAETCVASHYGHGDGYNGRKTANGEKFDTYRHMTAPMRKQPFGSYVTVTNLSNGRSVRVRINDRGPFVAGRCVDLSYVASRARHGRHGSRVRPMNRGDAKTFLVAGILAAMIVCGAAIAYAADDKPSTWFCMKARQHRAAFTSDRAAEEAARAQGATSETIAKRRGAFDDSPRDPCRGLSYVLKACDVDRDGTGSPAVARIGRPA